MADLNSPSEAEKLGPRDFEGVTRKTTSRFRISMKLFAIGYFYSHPSPSINQRAERTNHHMQHRRLAINQPRSRPAGRNAQQPRFPRRNLGHHSFLQARSILPAAVWNIRKQDCWLKKASWPLASAEARRQIRRLSLEFSGPKGCWGGPIDRATRHWSPLGWYGTFRFFLYFWSRTIQPRYPCFTPNKLSIWRRSIMGVHISNLFL